MAISNEMLSLTIAIFLTLIFLKMHDEIPLLKMIWSGVLIVISLSLAYIGENVALYVLALVLLLFGSVKVFEALNEIITGYKNNSNTRRR